MQARQKIHPIYYRRSYRKAEIRRQMCFLNDRLNFSRCLMDNFRRYVSFALFHLDFLIFFAFDPFFTKIARRDEFTMNVYS